jgi:hypothetical protein
MDLAAMARTLGGAASSFMIVAKTLIARSLYRRASLQTSL